MLAKPAGEESPTSLEAQVAVIGTGPRGLIAAVAAARCGARTILLDRSQCAGVLEAPALMTCFTGFRNERPPDHVQTVRGLPQELVDRLLAAGGASGYTSYGNYGALRPGQSPYAVSFNFEALKTVAADMLTQAGVEVHTGASLRNVTMQEHRVVAASLDSDEGPLEVKAAVFVDAAGEADLAAAAGAQFQKSVRLGPSNRCVSLVYRVSGLPPPMPDQRRSWCSGITTLWGPTVLATGATPMQLADAEERARQQLADQIREMRKEHRGVELLDVWPTHGAHAPRRILGLYTITETDCLLGHRKTDSIAVSSSPVSAWYGRRRFLDHLGFDIPYRSIVPLGLDNLFIAGRCISACEPAMESARALAPAMAVAQAAGTAAALCAEANRTAPNADVAALQNRLLDDGAVLHPLG